MLDDGKIDDKEFFILHEANCHRKLYGDLPYYKNESFNVQQLCADECEVECQSTKHL